MFDSITKESIKKEVMKYFNEISKEEAKKLYKKERVYFIDYWGVESLIECEDDFLRAKMFAVDK